MTEEERLEKRKKTGMICEMMPQNRSLTRTVLYLRHRLQKGFLTRNQAPKVEDMSAMSGYMAQLEELQNLEPEIIKETKVHKVLRGILKLGQIPRDEEFKITSRSQELLSKWGSLTAGEDAADEAAAPATNGVKSEEKKAESPTEEKKEEPASTVVEEAKPKDADGDVTMTESAPQPKEDAPAAQTNGDAEAEKAEAAVDAVA